MSYIVDLSRQRFGRWNVLKRTKPDGAGRYVCSCDCGTVKEIAGATLLSKRTNSCGCLNSELITARNYKHGETAQPLYRLWQDIKKRCYNPRFHQFKDYGGRGIAVCDEWVNDYESFREWAVSNGYQKGLTIDRIDNNGQYSPRNCRFTTYKVQNNNKRSNRTICYGNETKTLMQWAKRLGINESVIRGRLQRGWSIENALTTPVRRMQSCGV